MKREEIEEKLCEIIKEILEEQETSSVTCEDTLSEIGLNSIHFISIIVQSEVEFDIEFEDDFLSLDKFTNVSSIVDYILQLRC